jgi:hypothetical protein
MTQFNPFACLAPPMMVMVSFPLVICEASKVSIENYRDANQHQLDSLQLAKLKFELNPLIKKLKLL